MFEVSTGKEIKLLKGHRQRIVAVSFSPDGGSIASVAADCTVRLWSIRTGEHRLASDAPQSAILSLAFAANDTILIEHGWEPMIRCWDAATGKQIRKLVGHPDPVGYFHILPGGRTLLSAAQNHTDSRWDFRRWNLATGKEIRRPPLDDATLPLDLASDGKTLAAIHYKKGGRLYDVETGKEVGRFGDGQTVNAVFLPNGQFLVLQIGPGGFGLWDVKAEKMVHRFQGNPDNYWSMAISPDGSTLLGGRAEGGIERWVVSTGERLLPLQTPPEGIDCLVFSPDGRTLAAGCRDSIIYVWEVASGQPRGLLCGHRGAIYSLAFSRDGRRLASGSKDTTALVWDLTDGIAADPPKELTAKQLDELWRDLAGEDAVKAYRSIWTLALAPKQSVPFLQTHLQPVPAGRQTTEPAAARSRQRGFQRPQQGPRRAGKTWRNRLRRAPRGRAKTGFGRSWPADQGVAGEVGDREANALAGERLRVLRRSKPWSKPPRRKPVKYSSGWPKGRTGASDTPSQGFRGTPRRSAKRSK